MNEATPNLDSYEIVPEHIRKLLDSKANVMLHGAAGTGKSTLLRAISKHRKNVVILAPTGIAALNVGGQTLHSFFGFSFGFLEPGQVKGCPRNYGLLNKRPLIIIDEVSMVRADVFNAIDLALRRTFYSQEPFAGLQILLLGDTGQLPPIVTDAEEKFFKPGKEMFFNSDSYISGKFEHVELEKIHRQTSQNFIDFLLRVRNRKIKQIDLDWFNSKVEIMSTSRYFKTVTSDSTVLCMTNARADMYNKTMYDKLDTPEMTYEATITGRFNESEYPTQEFLGLKVGAKVVLLKNSKDKKYVNGSVGVISRLSPEAVHVIIKDEECLVEADKWEKYAYADSTDGVEKVVVGVFKQIPVRLA